MKLRVYSVFDAKAAVFDRPFYEQSDGSAVRAFSDAVNDSRMTVNNVPNMFFKHPEDYSLFCLGEFDSDTGVLIGEVPPKCLVTAAALKLNSVNGVNEKIELPA